MSADMSTVSVLHNDHIDLVRIKVISMSVPDDPDSGDAMSNTRWTVLPTTTALAAGGDIFSTAKIDVVTVPKDPNDFTILCHQHYLI